MKTPMPLFDLQGWGGALGVLGVALLLGRAAWWRVGRAGWGDAWLLRAALGLALAWLAVLVVGHWREMLFRAPWRWMAAAGWMWFAESVWNEARPALLSASRAPSHGARSISQSIARVGRVSGHAILWFYLLPSLFPLLAPQANYDVLEYHLGVVPHFFEARRIVPLPGIFYTAQPIGTELLYTLSSIIERNAWGHAPGLAHWLLALLTAALALRALAAWRVPAAWRPWLVLLTFAQPLMQPLLLQTKTDLTGVTMLAAGLLAWRVARPPGASAPGWRSALAVGLFAGAALGSKWTNAGTVVAPLGLLAALGGALAVGRGLRLDAAVIRRMASNSISFLCGLLLVFAAWPAWLWRRAGNPFAPWLADIFPTDHWHALYLQNLLDQHYPVSPLELVYWTRLLERLTAAPPHGWIFALALAAAAAAALGFAMRPGGSRRARAMRYSFAIATVLGIGMTLGLLPWAQLHEAADRFLAPACLLAALILALALGGLLAMLPRARRLAGVALSLSIFIVLAAAAWHKGPRVNPWVFNAYALGHVSRSEMQSILLGNATAEFFDAANRLPACSIILTVNEARRYPFLMHTLVNSVFDLHPLRELVRQAPDPDALRRMALDCGFTHLAVNDFEMLRILRMHCPPALRDDPEVDRLARAAQSPGPGQLAAATLLMDRYAGATEFALDPLSDDERKVYREFLARMRHRAIWQSPANAPPDIPAIWIAPLAD